MASRNRGSSFWLFIFGVALGGALGAVLTHKFLTGPRSTGARDERPAGDAPAAPRHPPSTDETTEDRIARKLREWRLAPDDIRRELDRAGEVIRRESRALGDRLGGATLDARIVTVIKARYTLDRELSAWDIAVASNQGHVTLSGTVNSPELIGRAIVLALDTEGVVDVVSSLRVKPAARPAEAPGA